MKEDEKLLRRILHSMTWIVLVYYLIPDPILGYSKRFWLIVIASAILAFEALRLYFGFDVYGMRHYEKRQIASYAWAAMAAGITLFFFPMHLAVVCLVGMGVGDPLIGEIQFHASYLYPYVPLLVWGTLAVLILSILTDFSMLIILIMASTGSIVAIIAEYPSIMIDDDFLMIVTPLFVLRVIELILV